MKLYRCVCVCLQKRCTREIAVLLFLPIKTYDARVVYSLLFFSLLRLTETSGGYARTRPIFASGLAAINPVRTRRDANLFFFHSNPSSVTIKRKNSSRFRDWINILHQRRVSNETVFSSVFLFSNNGVNNDDSVVVIDTVFCARFRRKELIG